MDGKRREPRCALLIRCSKEEAAAIREAAKLERRTVSAFVLQAVMHRISVQQRFGAAVPGAKGRPISPPTYGA